MIWMNVLYHSTIVRHMQFVVIFLELGVAVVRKLSQVVAINLILVETLMNVRMVLMIVIPYRWGRETKKKRRKNGI